MDKTNIRKISWKITLCVLLWGYLFSADIYGEEAKSESGFLSGPEQTEMRERVESRLAEKVPRDLEETGATREMVKQIIKEELSREIRYIVEEEVSKHLAKSGGEILPESQMEIIVGGSSAAGNDMKLAPVESPMEELNAVDLETAAGKELERALEQSLVERGGMLLPKGKLQIEPSFSAAHFSSNRINIQGFSILPVLVIGEISTESVKRDILISALAMRYGLWTNLQSDISIPYRYEHDRVNDNMGTERTRAEGGLGDIAGSISRQFAWEKGWMPDILGSVSVKSDTGSSPYGREIGLGTGHWAVKGALMAAKTSDPSVVFGNINYTWNIERPISDYGIMDPGDTIGYALGAAIALSYQTAINFQYEQSITSKMEKDGLEINGSFLNAANFKSGFTWSISEKVSVDFSANVGLTTDSPDYSITLKVPYTF